MKLHVVRRRSDRDGEVLGVAIFVTLQVVDQVRFLQY